MADMTSSDAERTAVIPAPGDVRVEPQPAAGRTPSFRHLNQPSSGVPAGPAADAPPPDDVRPDAGWWPRRGERGARAGAVPVLTLVAARGPWLAAGAAAGLVAGLLAGGGAAVAATATLRLSDAGQDSQRTQQVGQTIEQSALSASVLDEAARARRTTRDDLAGRVSAGWQDNTDLVAVTVTGSDPQGVVDDANAVAEAVVAQEQADAASRLEALRRESAKILSSGSLKGADAERARRSQLGSSLANRQDDAAAGAGSVFVSDPASRADSAGPSRVVLGLLGLVAGLLLAAAVALLAPAGLLRFRRPAALAALAPDLRVRGVVEGAPLAAGELLTSGRSTLVVLGVRHSGAAAARFAEVVVGQLRGHGRTVTAVDALGGRPDLPGTPAEVLRVLRHGVRSDVPGRLGTDLLVVTCEAHADALAMVSGQVDLHVAVVARRGTTRLDDVRAVTSATAAAAPLVVVA